MMGAHLRRVALGAVAASLASAALPAQPRAFDSVAVMIENSYSVTPNVVYRTTGGVDLRLDLYLPRRATAPVPTLVYFFGGGWVVGSKDRAVMRLLPWLAKGWAVVNVDYRLARTALAPAAVEDARCALAWVFDHAKEHRFDSTRVVTAGHSAGGHLALMAGMAPRAAGFERECVGSAPMPAVAAIVNWYGPTVVDPRDDVPPEQSFTVRWLGNQHDRDAIARRVSPLTWVRPGAPPVITVHGDSDGTVPYAAATALKEALDRAGVINELVTIVGGGHGVWPMAEWVRAEEAVDRFLRSRGLAVPDSVRRAIFSLPAATPLPQRPTRPPPLQLAGLRRGR